MSGWKSAWILAGTCFLTAPVVVADVYHYVDDRGRKIYVDRKSQVPIQYRDQLEVRAERKPARQSRSLMDAPELEGAVSIQSQRRQLETYIKSLETSVKIMGNSVLVPVKVRYGNRTASLQLVLDTGATRTVIHSNALKSLKVYKRPAGKAQVAGGGIIDTHSVTFDSLEVGPYDIESVSSGVIDHQGVSRHDGLLGMDFLRQVQYEVDFDRSVVIWSRDQYREAQANLAKLDTLEEEQKKAAAEEKKSRQDSSNS